LETTKIIVELATQARCITNELIHLYHNETNQEFNIHIKKLYKYTINNYKYDSSIDEYIEVYVQIITYSIILSSIIANKNITPDDFKEFIPNSLYMFGDIFDLYVTSFNTIFDMINVTDTKQTKKELTSIYFYEQFLCVYNPQKRITDGVFYTPLPVVQFIVKTINQTLIKDLNMSGLDDKNVALLDFATGTGTFLLESFRIALKNNKNQNNYVCNNFYGFENSIMPFIIAHFNLNLFLSDNGFNTNERVKIYLTDTLEDDYIKSNLLIPNKLPKEIESAKKIKMNREINVIMGNPPYSNYSKNKKPFIQTLINDYKKDLQETKINLDDDYIKFIRFAQCKIEGKKYNYQKDQHVIEGEIKGTGQGVVGIITNNSYLSGVTYRQMRKSLLQTFDKIYILNLHGNSIIGEKDKNIFDITVGVSITLYIKTPKPLIEKEVYYFSTLDNDVLTRNAKNDFLYDNDLETIDWKRIYPEEPYYWFIGKDFTHDEQYTKGWSLSKIFNVYNSGIKTDRDTLFIDKDKIELEKRMKILFSENHDNKFKEIYNVKDSSSYKLTEKIRNQNFCETNIKNIHYRAFDFRNIYYQTGVTSRPSNTVHQNIIDKENLAIVFTRLWSLFNNWSGCIISNSAIDIHLIGGQSNIAPLYIYNTNGNTDENGNGFLFKDETKKDNFTKEFRLFIKEQKWQNHTPEQILGYIYAVMFAPTYRIKYFEFFKIDFTKIPFTDDLQIFDKMSELGSE